VGTQSRGHAIRKGRDDLARAALVERNKASESSESATRELQLLEETLAKLSEDTGALQNKIKDAKTRQNAIIMRGKAAKTRLGVKRQLNDANLDDAIHRFEQYEHKWTTSKDREAFDLGQHAGRRNQGSGRRRKDR
jgi:phage shock protein A